MALKRKRVAPPQFYDVESNVLYPEQAKKRKYDDLCRICTSPTSSRNELVDIFGLYGRNLKLSEMVDRFLPIVILESDGFSHSICFSCRDILIKMDQLYTICQKSDLYFYQQRNSTENTEPEMLEVFDGEDLGITVMVSPTLVPDDPNSEPEGSPDPCLPEGHETIWGNEDSVEENVPAMSENSATTTKTSATSTMTKSITPTKTKNSVTPTKTNKYVTRATTRRSATSTLTERSATSTMTKRSATSTMTKHSDNWSKTQSKNVRAKSERQSQEIEQDSDTDTSNSEDEGNQDSDDPDFVPEEIESKTALIPKKLPFKCEYCSTVLKISSAAENHYESEHGMHLCTSCFVHYQNEDELSQHLTEEHPEPTSKTKFFRCELCISNFFTKQRLKSHLKQKHDTQMCFKCSTTFEDQVEYEKHLQSANHGMVCRICKSDFWAMDTWKKHVQHHYSYDIVKVVMHSENSTGVPVEISEFTCSVEAQDKLSSIKAFPFQCDFCDEPLSDESVAHEHYKLHDMLLCRYCFHHFPTATELDKHKESNHTFSCALCPYSIIAQNANALKDHLTTVHSDIYFNKNRVYGCGICHMRFSKKRKVKKHMTETHGKFTCYVCLKCFNDDSSYQIHLEIEDHDHRCSECNVDFTEEHNLFQHVKKYHPDQASEFRVKEKKSQTIFTCDICNSVHTKLYTIKRHYLEFHQKFMCHFCRLVFDSHSEIDAHSLEVHGCNTSWSYQCSECEKYFETVEMLTLHIKTVHEKSADDKYLCDTCGRACKTKFKLREHVLNFHDGTLPDNEKVRCDVCHLLVREKIMEKHLQRHKLAKNIVCADCGRKFLNTGGLKLHIKNMHRHLNPTIVECPHCRLPLDRIKMKKHIEEEHTAEWTYVCNYCDVFHQSETEIWQHCTSEHDVLQDASVKPFSRTSPYQCETCFAYLANAFKLDMHRYTDHSDTTVPKSKQRTKEPVTIICELCGDTIKKPYKSIHMYQVHKVPHKYPCELCDQSFRTEQRKLKHVERSHAKEHNIVCDICDRGFANRKYMMVHQRRVHSESQELPCRFCDKKLKNKDNLNKHEKMHSALMPFRCEICDIGFHRNAAYKNHMSRHENNKRIFQPWKKRVEIIVPA